MTAVGVRELKDNLSHYIRKVERGQRVMVTAHGRIVAELRPPERSARKGAVARVSRWEQMIAAGTIRPAAEAGDPFEGDTPAALVEPGSSSAWLDWSREDK